MNLVIRRKIAIGDGEWRGHPNPARPVAIASFTSTFIYLFIHFNMYISGSNELYMALPNYILHVRTK